MEVFEIKSPEASDTNDAVIHEHPISGNRLHADKKVLQNMLKFNLWLFPTFSPKNMNCMHLFVNNSEIMKNSPEYITFKYFIIAG